MKCLYTRILRLVKGEPNKCGFTIIESVLTLVIIAASLTAIFSLQTHVMRSVFGVHDMLDYIIAVRNFMVTDDQEEYYKQVKGFEKKFEHEFYTINYEPKSCKSFPGLASYKNIVVEKFNLSSKSIFINYDEFVFFRFNPGGKK